MRTGGGSCSPSTSQDSQGFDGALLEATNIELQYVVDSDTGELLRAVPTLVLDRLTKY